MGTAVDERVDSELTTILDNEEEVPCIGCSKPATHSAVLECKHSFLVCDNHARRVRVVQVIAQTATCFVCHKVVGLLSLNHI